MVNAFMGVRRWPPGFETEIKSTIEKTIPINIISRKSDR
jgi:hypothetical protein